MPLLVIQRKLSERVMIGDDIVVQIVRISGDRVRLAITAPASVRVDREEVRAAMTGTATAGDVALCRAICDAGKGQT